MCEMRDTFAAEDDDGHDQDSKDSVDAGAQDTEMVDLGEELGEMMATGSDNKERLLDDPEYIAGLACFDTQEDKERWTDEFIDVMLEVAEKEMLDYLHSTDSPDPETIEAIIRPAEAAAKEVALERAMRATKLRAPAEDDEMEVDGTAEPDLLDDLQGYIDDQ